MADSVAATFVAMSTMFAIYQRDQGGSGRGQVIDVSLYEPLFRLVESQVIGFDQLGIVKERLGNRLAEDSPRNTYRTADGRWLAISASSQKTFERLMETMGMPDLISDPRYATNALRCDNADTLDEVIGAWFATRKSNEVMALFEESGVVAGPVLDIADIFSDPHYKARESIVEVPDEDFGMVRMQNVAPRFSATPGRVRHPGGSIGADNREIFLGELGLSEDELAACQRDGII